MSEVVLNIFLMFFGGAIVVYILAILFDAIIALGNWITDR